MKNPRKNDDAVAGVVHSIKRFGFGSPLLARVANGELIAGHTRLKAAFVLVAQWGAASERQREAWQRPFDERDPGADRWSADAVRIATQRDVPVRYLDISEKEAHLLALADNKLGEKAAWDDSVLLEILQGYGAADVSIAGWSDSDLKLLEDSVFKEKEIEEDEPPDPPKVATSKVGDVWTCGRHRVLCGDSTKGWDALMPKSETFDLVFTDPPYDVDYVGKTKDALVVHNDGAEGLPALLAGAFDATLARTKPGGIWYVCAPPGPNIMVFGEALIARELWRQSIMWAKDVLVMGRSDFHYQHEQIFYGWKPGAPHRPPPNRKQTTLWQFDRPKKSEHHPTMKPVKLVAHAIEMSTVAGELVGEPFGGSGTTLIAAEQLERSSRVIEYSPNYVDVIVERWQNLSGGKATRKSA